MTGEPVVLRGGGLELSAYPGHGFVISQLTDAATGAGLLWTAGRPAEPCPADLGPPGAASVDRFERDLLVGGWFVMFPTVGLPGPGARGRWMHGEAARLPWTLTGLTTTSAVAEVRTPASGFQVTRSLRLDADGLTVRTVAVNRSDLVRPISYGEHPCLSRPAFAGGRLRIPASRVSVLPCVEPAAATVPAGPVPDWPRVRAGDGQLVDLGLVPSEPDGAHDHVSIELSAGTVEIPAPALGRRLQMSFDTPVLGHVLLWRHHARPDRPGDADVFAVEPASAPGRSFPEAVAAGRVRLVGPGERVEFGLRLRWLRGAA
ncbi:MAG TPA: hypothetical protein VH573_22125 [Mycobacteriales bacterium]|jgi:galactose mutarotase-like enzyme